MLGSTAKGVKMLNDTEGLNVALRPSPENPEHPDNPEHAVTLTTPRTLSTLSP